MNKLLVLAYNEESKIKETITSQLEVFDEIIVVNDGSNDSTKHIIQQIANRKNTNKLILLSHKNNMGYGAALKTGINRIAEMDDKSNLNPRKIDRVNSKKCKLVNKSG